MSSSQTPVIFQYNQAPDADLDYLIDWASWLAAEPGDSILTSTWTVPTGLSSHGQTLTGGTKAIIWLSGGTLGVNYLVTCSITTAQGRTDEQSFRLFIQLH